jgi:hypothetical protein
MLMTTAAWVAAEAEWQRDQFEADRLAGELGCEVTPNPYFVDHFDVRGLPGVWLMTGRPDEIRAEAACSRPPTPHREQALIPALTGGGGVGR